MVRQAPRRLKVGRDRRSADGDCANASSVRGRLQRERNSWGNEKRRRGHRRLFLLAILDVLVMRDAEAFRAGDAVNSKSLAVTVASSVAARAVHKAASAKWQRGSCI